jgi:hypothetical protein
MKRWTLSIVALSAVVSAAASAQFVASASPNAGPPPAPTASAAAGYGPEASPATGPEIPTQSTVRAASLPIDGAYSLPGGIWNCETLANSVATSVYKMTAPRTMLERTTLHLPHRPPVELDTTFVYDPQRDRWGLSMQKGAYVATAPPWSTATWTFAGTEVDGDPHRNVRLVYTSLGPDAYRSDYEALIKNAWQTFSGATCRREIP